MTRIVNFFTTIIFNTLFYLGIIIYYLLLTIIYCIIIVLGVIFLPILEDIICEIEGIRIKKRNDTQKF